MKHCHLALLCNDLPFIKQKLPFLYNHFDQIIFVDFNILKNTNSSDGSIKYIKKFKDKENKIKLLIDFDPKKVNEYSGVSMVEKQKMLAYGSKFINKNIDVVWATDSDEFFKRELIDKVEEIYKKNSSVISIDVPHTYFVYNQYNIFKGNELFYIKPRITRHKRKIYGHCDFDTYGKTVKLPNQTLYHFSYVGYDRCKFKIDLFNKKNQKHNTDFLKKYKNYLENGEKIVELYHPGNNMKSSEYKWDYPKYLDVNALIKQLNIL